MEGGNASGILSALARRGLAGRNCSEKAGKKKSELSQDTYIEAGRREDYSALGDEELVSLIGAQDRYALEELYARYSSAVFSLTVQMLADSGAAEEVTQDAFFNVWRSAGSYRPDRGKVSTWLFSIAHNRVIDETRRRRRHYEDRSTHDVALLAAEADDSGDPSGFVMKQMRRSKIKEALSGLRPEQRDVVVFAYYGGLSQSEIARKLGQPLGTVKTRMRLGLRALKRAMGPQARELA